MKIKDDKLHGRVEARAFGAYPEGFLNSLAAAGIELWNVEAIDANTVSFALYESRLEELESIAKRCFMELEYRCRREHGRRLFKKRFVLLALIFSMGIGLLVSSLFIWQIDIYGSSALSRGELLRALEDSGVSVGSFWPGLKTDEVRSRMMLLCPQIGWMTVNISGSRAIVVVNDRLEKPEIYDEAAASDLVASKSGLVRRVSVLSGRAAAEPGQAVLEGELLIGGRLESIMGTARSVCARGTVMAETWCEKQAVCPQEEEIKSEKALSLHRFALIFGKRRINFYISSGKAIDGCDKIIDEYTLGLQGLFALPVRLVHERLVPYALSPGSGCDSQAMGRRLINWLEANTQGQILQSSLTESCAEGLYTVTLRAHCMENIALAQPFEN